jgi:phospholipid/cholesterol/gamma-HCH transport system permease protein
MLDTIARLGNRGVQALQGIGSSGLFLFSMLFRKPNVLRLWPLLRYQLYFIGVLSCLIIVVSALFIGMVVGLQGYNTLQKFGASSQLGQRSIVCRACRLGSYS